MPVYALHSRHFNKFEIERAQHQLNSTRGEEIKTPKSKNTAEYRFEIFAGVNQISKSISGFENLIVELRRNSWETEVHKLAIEFYCFQMKMQRLWRLNLYPLS